jgi:hypothetical protein
MRRLLCGEIEGAEDVVMWSHYDKLHLGLGHALD